MPKLFYSLSWIRNAAFVAFQKIGTIQRVSWMTTYAPKLEPVCARTPHSRKLRISLISTNVALECGHLLHVSDLIRVV